VTEIMGDHRDGANGPFDGQDGQDGQAGQDGQDGPADPGEWLVVRRGVLDRGEAAWLDVLARFDRDMGWALDGQTSCVGWLVWATGMSRGTAFEKVRVAHQLWRRPVVAEAFAAGEISYSAVRAITRLVNPDPDVDAALVGLAKAGTVRDLERAVRHYQLCADQDLPPDVRRLERRGLQLRSGWGGLGTAEIVLDEAELAEFDVVLRAFMDNPAVGSIPGAPVDESSRDDCSDSCARPAPGDPVDESSRDESVGAPFEAVPIWRRRVDAFMDLIRAALANLGGRHAGGDDRYLLHIVTGPDGRWAEHLDGTPIHPTTAARLACDASTVTHHHADHGELLDLGRRTRVWNRAQRRAANVRDGGNCRFPGCDRTICDIHHLRPWTAGGPTDLGNGILICTRHHTMLHEGFNASGDANGIVTFTRPDGTELATSAPRRWQPVALVGA
jgi:hypothetical protein